MERLKVSSHFEGQWLKVILSNGKGNIIDTHMMDELLLLLHDLKYKKEVKVITIEGEGQNFSYGASVEEHKKELAPAMLKKFHQLFYTFIDTSILTIAKVSGYCLGGGMELALISNHIFADKTAKFGLPEITLGVFPPPASILLPEKIGLARAEELLLSGITIDADKAHHIGIVNYLFETKEEMDRATEEYISKNILPRSGSSLRYVIKASRWKLANLLKSFLPPLENLYINELMETHDANEGINSFLQKRTPVWQNK